MPRVSFIVPLYNRADLVVETLDSIARQTYKDFEVVIVDDCSKDNSCEIVEDYPDKRIKLIRNEQNLGVARTLNRAIEAASGEYLARMDSDDLCTPDRLERQVQLLDERKEVGIVFSLAKSFGEGRPIVWRTQTDPEVMRASFIITHDIAHPTAMMRRESLDAFGLRYREDSATEDYDLWTRAIEHFAIATIPRVLLLVRLHNTRITKTRKDILNADSNFIRERELKKFGVPYSEEEFRIHCKRGNAFGLDKDELVIFRNWLDKILDYNQEVKYYRQDALQQVLAEHWYTACRYSDENTRGVFGLFRSSHLSRHAGRNFVHRLYRNFAILRAHG